MTAKTIYAITLAAAMVTITGCATDSSKDGIFDPRTLGDPQRTAAREVTSVPLRPLPTTLQSQFLPDDNGRPSNIKEPPVKSALAPDNRVYRLPLREIAQRTVANNLNVKVSGFAPAIEETRVTEAEARFDPEVFANATYTAARDPGNGQFSGANSDTIGLETGLRQLLPSGGQVELSYRPAHINLEDTATSNNTLWTSGLQLQLTQPLLRDFGNDVNQARIVINRLNQRISVLDFRKDLEEAVRTVEEVYWRLVQAEQNKVITENLLQRTIDTADLLARRRGQDVTLEQISNSVSRIESTRNDLIRARQRVNDLSDQLKALMNDPDYPTAGNQLLLPADKPLETGISFELTDSINSALLNRFDLAQQQLRVDSAGVALNVAKNNKLPQLNFVGSIGRTGLGEDFSSASENGFNSSSDISWSAGLQFSQKIGNREANAIYRRAQLQRMQAITQYQQLIENATLEVKIAQREVETSYESIVQVRAAKFAAAKALEVIEILERGGEALVPRFVESKLNRQQDLAQSERTEADAIATYNIAIATLEQRKGTLLRYNNIVLDEKSLQK